MSLLNGMTFNYEEETRIVSGDKTLRRTGEEIYSLSHETKSHCDCLPVTHNCREGKGEKGTGKGTGKDILRIMIAGIILVKLSFVIKKRRMK